MLYLFPAILTPTILLSLWYALRQDIHTAMHLNARMVMLQKQFYQNRPY